MNLLSVFKKKKNINKLSPSLANLLFPKSKESEEPKYSNNPLDNPDLDRLLGHFRTKTIEIPKWHQCLQPPSNPVWFTRNRKIHHMGYVIDRPVQDEPQFMVRVKPNKKHPLYWYSKYDYSKNYYFWCYRLDNYSGDKIIFRLCADHDCHISIEDIVDVIQIKGSFEGERMAKDLGFKFMYTPYN